LSQFVGRTVWPVRQQLALGRLRGDYFRRISNEFRSAYHTSLHEIIGAIPGNPVGPCFGQLISPEILGITHPETGGTF
jgi:hypothetical protein